MIRQALNLPLPFPRSKLLRMPALRCIYLHGLCGYVISNFKASHCCPSQLEQFLRMPIHDKFLQALVVIVLVFRVLAIAIAFGILS